MIRAGNEVRLKVSGSPVDFVDEICNTTDDRIYTINDKTKEIWDITSPVIVKDSGVPVTEPFVIDYTKGTVIFQTVKPRSITVSGKYVTTTSVGRAYKYSLSEKCDIYDVTAFGDTYRKRMKGELEAEGSISDFDVLDTYYRDALLSGKPILIEISHYESDPKPKRLWALLESRELEAAIGDPQSANISFKSHGRY